MSTSCVVNTNEFTKDPDSVLDFAVDWTKWLDEGETIASSDWIIPDGITEDTDQPPSHTDTVATIWLTGGTDGAWLQVVNRITTNQGRTEDQTLSLHIEEH